jgi:hypothetical protein
MDSHRQREELLESLKDSSFIRAVLQIAKKCFTQHFAGKSTLAISVRWS